MQAFSTERHLSPPDEPSRGGGDFAHYVERPVPTTAPDTDDLWVELEVECHIDDGRLYAAYVDGAPFHLTADEVEAVEEEWVWHLEAQREWYEADAYDRAGDR